MKKIFVIGASGQTGQALKSVMPELNYLDRKILDLSDPMQITEFFKQHIAETIVNLSAYTNVERAEEERDLAHKVNAVAVQTLAQSCRRFLHISSDFVFSGAKNTPYQETDATGPVNYYGVTKLEGEKLAADANPATMIFRTSLVYSAIGNNFIKKVLEFAATRKSLSFVDDVTCSPTRAKDLADVIKSVLVQPDRFQPGIFHFSDEGVGSRYDIVKAICRLKNLKVSVFPVPSSAVPSVAQRPAYSVLDKSKIRSALGLHIPHWYDNLAEFFKEQM